jgi:hypothetical protein
MPENRRRAQRRKKKLRQAERLRRVDRAREIILRSAFPGAIIQRLGNAQLIFEGNKLTSFSVTDLEKETRHETITI